MSVQVLKKTKREPLSQEDLADLDAKRAWVCSHYDDAARIDQYITVEGKLHLIDTILSNDWVEPHETLKLQCLGITLGDALAQDMGLNWISYEDEHSRDYALAVEGTSIVLFPLTMISKRVENGEEIDVYDLFEGIIAAVEEMKDQGEYNWVQ